MPIKGKKDYSTKMKPGGRRSKAGSNSTAGNSGDSSSKGFAGNKIGSVQNRHRYQKTRTRSHTGDRF